MNPSIPNDSQHGRHVQHRGATFQQQVLAKAFELEGHRKHRLRELRAQTGADAFDEGIVRSVANELDLDQTYVDQALQEPIVTAPRIGQAGPLTVERYIAHPPCHVRRAAETYLITCEAMEVGTGIPDGFTIKNTYDTSKFAYDWTELTMWSLTGLECTITPLPADGVVVQLKANMTSERIAAIGGAVATAAAVTPSFVMIEQIHSLLPFVPMMDRLAAGGIGLAIGGIIGVLLGRFWWKEECETRVKVLTRAIQGIAAMADSDTPLLAATHTAVHPETGEELPPGLGNTVETLDEALETLHEQRKGQDRPS